MNLDEFKKDLNTEELERQVGSLKQQTQEKQEQFRKVSLDKKDEIAGLMGKEEQPQTFAHRAEMPEKVA